MMVNMLNHNHMRITNLEGDFKKVEDSLTLLSETVLKLTHEMTQTREAIKAMNSKVSGLEEV